MLSDISINFAGRGIIRILDVLYVGRDTAGAFHADRLGVNVDAPSNLGESPLWQLLDSADADEEHRPAVSPEHYTACAIGLDLDAAERLAELVEPGASVLFMLVEPRWTTDLLDVVRTNGGFPIAFGCLEWETMLLIGPEVASAANATTAAERAAKLHGAAMLDALASAQPVPTTAAIVIPALIEARLLDDSDVDDDDHHARGGGAHLTGIGRARTRMRTQPSPRSR